MTDQEFKDATNHQITVIKQIEQILKDNKMSLIYTDGSIALCDDGRDIGYTGYYLDARTVTRDAPQSHPPSSL